MCNVPAPASRFNPTPTVRTCPDDNCPSLIPSDRAYESLAASMEAEDDARALAYWSEFEAGMESYADDQACQRADDSHVRELAAAVDAARPLAGVADVAVSRTIEHSSKIGRRVVYHARLDGRDACHFGSGDAPAAAVENLFEQLDGRYLVPAFGGWRVKGVALILSAHDRSKDDALALARRIVLEPAYLDVAISLHMPGVTDERQRPAPAAAVA